MKICLILAVLAVVILATVTMSEAEPTVGELLLSRSRRSSMNKCPPHAAASVCQEHCKKQNRQGQCKGGVCTCVQNKGGK